MQFSHNFDSAAAEPQQQADRPPSKRQKTAGQQLSEAAPEPTQEEEERKDDDGDVAAAAAVAAEEEEPEGWQLVGGRCFSWRHPGRPAGDGRRVLGLDMDGTVIRVKSGARWPRDRGDWTWWHPNVPEQLRKYAREGWQILVLTNQGGADNPKSLTTLQGKIEDILRALAIPGARAAMAAGYDQYRKPNPMMWRDLAGPLAVASPKDSLFVGDAAGRQTGWQKGAKKDHSCSDRQFAANLGVPFQTPEEFFLGQAAVGAWNWGGPSPRELLATQEALFHDKQALLGAAEAPQELVILVGAPASGKSTLAADSFETRGYTRVNRDILKTPAKCLKLCQEALKAGRSVVVDNTNPQRDTRAPYLRLAREFRVPVRCVWLTVDKPLAMHMARFRVRQSQGRHPRIPDVAMHTYFKRMEPPSVEEGFDSVLELPFRSKFASEADREAFLQWS